MYLVLFTMVVPIKMNKKILNTAEENKQIYV
jgi:hypothetical protein